MYTTGFTGGVQQKIYRFKQLANQIMNSLTFIRFLLRKYYVLVAVSDIPGV